MMATQTHQTAPTQFVEAKGKFDDMVEAYR